MFLSYGTQNPSVLFVWSVVEKKSAGLVFIFVYRLAIDAKTRKGDDGADWKYPSLLEDFQTGTPSMARKRHLASTARGLFGFCLMASQNIYSSYPWWKEEPILWRTALQAEASRWVLIRGRCPRLLRVVPSRHQSACGILMLKTSNPW